MLPDPLHPAVVHFPIVLAALLPLAMIWALIALRRSERPRAVWLPVAVMSVLLFASAWYAKETGEDQEDRVEEVVSHDPIHEHEEKAEAATIAAGITLALAALGLFPGIAGLAGRWAALAGAVVALVLVVQTGHSGGELVYEHGAAAAYTDGGSATTSSYGEREDGEHDDDD